LRLRFGRPERLSALLCLLLWAACALAEIAVPPLTARVTDTVGVLDAASRATLEAKLAAFEAERGTQIALLVVSTTDDEPIEMFGLRAAEAWRLGREKIDDGALLIVATADRRVRIEVGYGLEGVLTDATSKRIIDDAIVPAFRAGDVPGGISAGLERMMSVAAGEVLPPPSPASPQAENPWALALFFAVFFTIAFRGLRQAPLRVFGASTTAGAATLLLTQALPAAGLSVGAAVLMASLLGGGGGPRRWSSHRRYGNREPGGWSPGGFGGGGLGGGFGGFGGGGLGGGFGGGGGGFGGGGASGSW